MKNRHVLGPIHLCYHSESYTTQIIKLIVNSVMGMSWKLQFVLIRIILV